MSLTIEYTDNSVVLRNILDRFIITEELVGSEIAEDDIVVSFSKRFSDINYYDIQLFRYEQGTYVPFKSIAMEYDRTLTSDIEEFLGLNLLESGNTRYIKVRFEEIPV